jgi:CheY-like chemotaxis protein
MDLEMPVMDGYETCREILKFFPKLKIIGLTGHSAEIVQSKCLSLGMRNVITKPISNNLLKSLIDNIDD